MSTSPYLSKLFSSHHVPAQVSVKLKSNSGIRSHCHRSKSKISDGNAQRGSCVDHWPNSAFGHRLYFNAKSKWRQNHILCPPRHTYIHIGNLELLTRDLVTKNGFTVATLQPNIWLIALFSSQQKKKNKCKKHVCTHTEHICVVSSLFFHRLPVSYF